MLCSTATKGRLLEPFLSGDDPNEPAFCAHGGKAMLAARETAQLTLRP